MRVVERQLAAVAMACFGLVPLAGQTNVAPGTAAVDIVRDLLRSLWTYEGDGRPNASRQIGFQLPESAVNLYLASSLARSPRPMIESLQVQLLPGNRCIVEAKIDFDALDRNEPAIFSEAERKHLSGSKLVRAEFRFSVSAGALTFEPKPLKSEVTPSKHQLQNMIGLIAAKQPEKIDAARKIPVPFGLRKLWTSNGVLHGET